MKKDAICPYGYEEVIRDGTPDSRGIWKQLVKYCKRSEDVAGDSTLAPIEVEILKSIATHMYPTKMDEYLMEQAMEMCESCDDISLDMAEDAARRLARKGYVTISKSPVAGDPDRTVIQINPAKVPDLMKYSQRFRWGQNDRDLNAAFQRMVEGGVSYGSEPISWVDDIIKRDIRTGCIQIRFTHPQVDEIEDILGDLDVSVLEKAEGTLELCLGKDHWTNYMERYRNAVRSADLSVVNLDELDIKELNELHDFTYEFWETRDTNHSGWQEMIYHIDNARKTVGMRTLSCSEFEHALDTASDNKNNFPEEWESAKKVAIERLNSNECWDNDHDILMALGATDDWSDTVFQIQFGMVDDEAVRELVTSYDRDIERYRAKSGKRAVQTVEKLVKELAHIEKTAGGHIKRLK